MLAVCSTIDINVFGTLFTRVHMQCGGIVESFGR